MKCLEVTTLWHSLPSSHRIHWEVVAFAKPYDYIIWSAKNRDSIKFRRLLRNKSLIDDKEYRFYERGAGPESIRRLSERELMELANTSRIFRRQKLTSSGYTAS